jgi:uncharacterized protein YneF (UPF0154 family)
MSTINKITPGSPEVGLFKNRPTGEVVVILLTGLVLCILVFMVVGFFVVAVVRPDELEITGALAVVSDILTTIVGAIIGYVAGRNTGTAKSAVVEPEPPVAHTGG